MNNLQSKRGRHLPDSFPGCLGRMINISDSSAGMARTKLLTERPHRDAIKDCSDVVNKPMYPVVAEIEGKEMISQQRSTSSNKRSGGTPIKLLISQEMCGDTELGQKPPSIVARLMGLDSLPAQQSVITHGKFRNNGNLCNALTADLQHYRQQEGNCVDSSMACQIQSFTQEKEDYRDVYEVRQQPSKNIWVKAQSSPKVRYDENSYQRRMALVQQKFTEAKHLATDGKLLDSKEFQDAVEVLNSNRDLFLKFLEEPNSLFTKHFFEHQSISLPFQTTRITVLKPSNTMERKGNKVIKRQLLTDSDESVGKMNKHYWSSGFSEPKVQDLSQPTRIVVLKPSPGKLYDIKTTLPNNSPTVLGGRSSTGSLPTDELIAKGISTHQMQGSLSSNRRDETLVSSVLSNGYNGDESSFNRSECEYMEDEVGSLSDSEIATPATEYSWAYINKIASPRSASSLTRVSHLPESSVTREAKKRLSERLALVASNVNNQEQRQLRRTSSTLGEMLAITELKKEEGSKEKLTLSGSKSSNGEDDVKVASAFLSAFETKNEYTGENSHRDLSRSKSDPVSSSVCEVELNGGISGSSIGKPIVQTEVPRLNSRRSSFKDKVSSFFFSKSKKPSGEKPCRSPSVCDCRRQPGRSNGSDKSNDDLSQSVNDTLSAQAKLDSPNKMHDGSTPGTLFPEGVVSTEKPGTSGNFAQDQDQSSQISVSGAPLVEDVNNGLSQSCGSIIAGRPQALSRSPPIGSVARSYLDAASAKPSNPFMVFSKADEEHEQFVFVHKLISYAGMDKKKSAIFGGWHSLDSPLNQSLLYECLQNMEDEEEGKCCKKRRSSHRLLFDSVNAALLDISQSALLAAATRACSHETGEDETAGATVAEQVWAIVRSGLWGGDNKSVPNEYSMVVDRLVKEEVVGRQWDDEPRWLEMCEFSKDIGGQVLEELVEEALSQLYAH